MLVLSRKPKESVVVGGADRFERLLKVTVLEITGASVRLGFEADDDVPVHRAEVWEKVCKTVVPRRAAQARVLPEIPGIALMAQPRLGIQ